LIGDAGEPVFQKPLDSWRLRAAFRGRGAGRFSLDAWLARGEKPLSLAQRQDVDDIRCAVDDGMQVLRIKKPD